jgi:hypothetical protein
MQRRISKRTSVGPISWYGVITMNSWQIYDIHSELRGSVSMEDTYVARDKQGGYFLKI